MSPDLSRLKPWGSVCYAHVPEEKRKDKSLSARAIRCRFLGISEEYKAYRLYDKVNKRFLISRDVTFDSVYLNDMLKRAFENKAQPLTEKEKEEIKQLGLETPITTADHKIRNPSDEMVHLEDILDPKESIRSVGVPPFRSERHPGGLWGQWKLTLRS